MENENPLKELRLQLHYSPEQLSKVAGIRLASIGQAEEGFYTNPLPALLVAFGIKEGSRDHQLLIDEYHEYQFAKRVNNGPNGLCRLILDPIFNTHEHPLLTWRNQSGLATYGFCSAFCIHMAAVNNFEKHIMKILEVPPKSISYPLIQAGYDLSEFTEACQLYKATLLNRVRSNNSLKLVS